MTAQLMLEAAKDLEDLELPRNAYFNMEIWGQHPQCSGEPQLDNLCGTTACAAGWLSLMPKWRARGFKSKWHGSRTLGWELRACERNEDWEALAVNVFGNKAGKAMSQIFGETWLNKEDAIKRIRESAYVLEERPS